MSRPADPADRDLLVQNRALGDPTRHAVFVRVRDAAEPVGVAELTEHFGLNHNAIRQHLAKLCDAGLVIEERGPPSGPGRPPLRYRPVPGAVERWGGSSPYEELSLMLVELLRGGGPSREVGRQAGRRLAGEYGTGAGAVQILEAVARRLAFEPRVQATGTGTEVILDRCPFLTAAARAPEIVCDLHHGIAEGIAERAAGSATVDGLVVRPPQRAGCRIRVSVPTAGTGPE